MKILHAANFSLHAQGTKVACVYAADHAISNGLNRNGHCVFNFSVKDSTHFYRGNLLRGHWSGHAAMNRQLLDTAQRFAPEWLLLGHAPQVTPATLHAIRKALPHIRISQWWVDSLNPERVKDLEDIRLKLPCLDTFFCTTATTYAAQSLGATGQEGERIRFFPNICDGGVHTHRAFARREHRHDLLYIGRPDAKKLPLLALLQACTDRYRVGLYGQSKATLLGGGAYIDTIGNSKAGVNYSRFNQIPLYSSDRMIHLLGNGALTFCPRIPGMESLFTEKEVAYFENLEDLPDKLEEYLGQEDKCRATAQAGWEKAHRTFNEGRVTRFLLEATFEHPYSEDYEWLLSHQANPPDKPSKH